MEKALEATFSVVCVEDGTQGVKEGTSGNYDAILIDLNLNNPAMDGIAVINKLKNELGIESYYLAITAYTGPEWEQKCRDAGFDEFINKPVNFTQLKNMILAHESS
jgi:CheY-like chemotaxis protein